MITFSHPKMLAMALVGFMIVACETTTPRSGFPELSYAHLAPIRLDVARIDIVNAYRAPAAKPNVEHLFPVSPEAAAEKWARDRLKAAGPTGYAKVTIKQASVVEVPLKRTTGLKGMLTTDQSERYDGVLEISVRIVDGERRQRGSISSRAQRSKTVAENITPHDRDQVWFIMTEAMMNDLNAALEAQIRKHLGQFIR